MFTQPSGGGNRNALLRVSPFRRRGAARGVRERAYLRAFGQAVIGLVSFRSTPPARLLRRAALMGRIALLAERSQMTFEKMVKELDKRGALERIQEEMLTEKVLRFLVSQAKVTGGTPQPVAAVPENASTGEVSEPVQG